MLVKSASVCYNQQVGAFQAASKGGQLPGNVDLIARNSILDGIKLRYLYRDYDLSQQRYYSIHNMLIELSGWSETKVKDYVKFAKIKSGKRGGPDYDSFFIGGKLAKFIPVEWLEENLTSIVEVQVKAYLVEGDGYGLEAFNDAVWAAKFGKFRPSWYGAAGGRGRSEPGSRGISFSTGKADVHVGVRKYRGERPAVEGHVTGQVLRTVVNDVHERQDRDNGRGAAARSFPEVQYQAALRSARRFLRAVRSRGIVLTDYFKGVSYVSWERPLHEQGYDLLDEAEERIAVRQEMVQHAKQDQNGQLRLEIEE